MAIDGLHKETWHAAGMKNPLTITSYYANLTETEGRYARLKEHSWPPNHKSYTMTTG